ncbi:DEAD/DEAH box helicase [Bacillus sp. N3536]|nr:DEAD/DEAH box helicase [Bacillus sp. N3536]
MIQVNLKKWITQSHSWKTFKEFQLPVENEANYTFLDRKDDFYISLFSTMMDLIEKKDFINNKSEILSVAKGLEIYSLKETKNHFDGINEEINLLYASALYYLAGYTSSAYILANLVSLNDSHNEFEIFLWEFLKKDLGEVFYSELLNGYLNSGENLRYLDTLMESIELEIVTALKNNPNDFITLLITKALIEEFIDNNVWTDLKENSNSIVDIRKIILNGLNNTPQIWSFFPSQRAAVKKGILTNNEISYSLQMPTSAGKTAICELIIYNFLNEYKSSRVLFLVPFRALAYELKNSLSEKLRNLNISVKSIYGGNTSNSSEEININDVDVLISTPEMIMALEGAIPNIYDEFSLVICDEGHLLDDINRGLDYELLLTKLRVSKKHGHFRKFVFLSAIIPNIEEINTWLGGNTSTVITSDYKPTQIDYAFLKENIDNFYLNVNPNLEEPDNYKLFKFLVKPEHQYINSETGRLNTYKLKNNIKRKSVATSLKATVTGTVALFTTTKKGKSGVYALAEETIHQINTLELPNPKDYANEIIINKLKEHFELVFGKSYILSDLCEKGVLFHHGDLPQDIREIIENAIRNSEIRMIICNNTLSEGVNLPIKTLVINSTHRTYMEGNKVIHKDMLVRELKNLIGRAGRAGKETKGTVIFVNPNSYDLFTQLIENNTEEVTGTLYEFIKTLAAVIEGQNEKIGNRFILDNETIEKFSEKYLKIIDSLDYSLVSLLTEEIEIDELELVINKFVSNTFAFYSTTEKQSETLENIFQLRGSILKDYIKTGEFIYLKRNNLSIRDYNRIFNLVDLNDDIWLKLESPVDEKWVTTIIDIITSFPSVSHSIEEFNKKNRNILNADILKNIIINWIKGTWYEDMAKYNSLEINDILSIQREVIDSLIEPYANKIINTVSMLLGDEIKQISLEAKNWVKYLAYGLSNRTQLDLVEIGLSDRSAIIKLDIFLKASNFHYTDKIKLIFFLKEKKHEIVSQLSTELTTVSLEKLITDIDTKL